ncbi:MAG: ABC transporter permease [Ruminococcus sp.]|nr:ABC transporter permease [Ruminococcus sp.]MCD7773477.1 ABC transporter permease [Ruminococcus sp.]
MKSKLIALPYIIWMCVFTIIPLGLVVFFALTTENNEFTLSNLTAMNDYMDVLFRSVGFAVIATIICLVVGFPVALFISRMPKIKQSTMLMIVLLPMWINFLLRTYAWMTILEENGLINRFLGLFGIGPLNLMNNSGAVILGMVYNYLPFMILPIYSVMTKIDESVVEAAQDLGCSSVNVLRKITIPLSMPGITTGIISVFVPSVSTFIISRMLGGGTNDLIGDIIESQFLGNSYNPHLGSAMALVLIVLVLLIMSIFNQTSGEEAIV